MFAEPIRSEYRGLQVGDVFQAVRRSLGLVSLEVLTPHELVHSLRRNKVPFLSLAADPLHPRSGDRAAADVSFDPSVRALLDSAEFVAAVADDRGKFSGPHAEYLELESAWSRVGIPCICFKSAGIAPSFPYTSDNVDILVQPHHIQEARRVLLGLDYIELRNAEEPDKWLFRRFRAGQSVSAIHLHARVGWDQGFMLEPELWKRVRQSTDDPSTCVPGPEDAVLINLAHGLIENKNLSMHDLLKVRYALRCNPIDWEYLDRVARERGWLLCLHLGLALTAHLETRLFDESSIPRSELARFQHTLRSCGWLAPYWRTLEERDPDMPFAISFWTSKRLFFTKVWCDRHVMLGAKGPSTILSLARGFKQKSGIRPQNSMLLALSGADGSGKSTQAAALADALTTCAIRSKRVWTRVGSTPLLYALHRLRYRLHRRGEYAPVNDLGMQRQPGGHGSYHRSGYSLALWLVAVMFDYGARLQYLRWRLLRGDVVLADRYLCDAQVEFALRLPNRPRLAAALVHMLRWAAPRADREYLIRVDPALSDRRDPPLPNEPDRETVCAAYDRVALERTMHVVDGNRDLEIVASEVVHDALTLYMGRFRPLGNAPFFENDWQLNPAQSWTRALLSRFAGTDRPSL